MTTYTGTPQDDTFVLNDPLALNAYDGKAGYDTLDLQVSPTATASRSGLRSDYYLYDRLSGSLSSSIPSIEQLRFKSTAGTTVQATLRTDMVGGSGLTRLVGGGGVDVVRFIAFNATSATMPVVAISGFDPAPVNAWQTNRDMFALSINPEGAGIAYTLSAARGLNVLQALSGGDGDDTIYGSNNADILSPGRNGVDHLYGYGGNDSFALGNAALPLSSGQTVTTGANSLFDGGAGTDVLTIYGPVRLASAIVSIEGIDLVPAYTGANTTIDPSLAPATLTLDAAHIAMLPRDTFFTGGGNVTITPVADYGGYNFDGSHYVVSPGVQGSAARLSIGFAIYGGNGDGFSYVGTSTADMVELGVGRQSASGGPGDDTIILGQGDQTVTGGAGADTFVPNYGNSVITDFTPGGDVIDLADLGVVSFAQVLQRATQSGAATVITGLINATTDTLTLANVAVGSLTARDFRFAAKLTATGDDFNGDQVADVLFRRADDALSTWQLVTGGSVASGGALGNPGARQIATGDFDGDGMTDVLLRTRAGALTTWQLFGTAIVGGGAIGDPGMRSIVLATGDFNGDGRADILLRDAVSGDYRTWYLNGSQVIGGGSIGNPGAQFMFKAAADFDGDGKADLLFQQADGSYAIRLLNDATIAGGGTIGNPGADYFFKGVGDFNADGRSDILFERGDGAYATWDLNGARIIGGGLIGNPGTAYAFARIGDYSGDGYSDILFRKTDGSFATWTLNDTTIVGGTALGSPGPGYTVAADRGATADFGHLIFQDSATGAVAGWSVSGGATIVASGTIGAPGTAWVAQGTGDFAGTGEIDILFRNAVTGLYATFATNGVVQIGGGVLGNPGLSLDFRAIGDFNGDGRSDILFQRDDGAYGTWAANGGGFIGAAPAAGGYAFAATGDIDGDGKTDIVFRDAAGTYARG